jgi:integrase
LFFGVLAREGMRVSEALGLTWSDVDLVRGVVRLDSNKTDDPRTWALGSDVVAALTIWRKRITNDSKMFLVAALGDRGDFAHHLREGLKRAGVARPELFAPHANRLPLRAHDLRGSFVTLALAIGRTEAWVTDRTGHRSSAMVYTYKRAARTATELGLGWFAPLHHAIPEFGASAPSARRESEKTCDRIEQGGHASRDDDSAGATKLDAQPTHIDLETVRR